MRHQVYSIAITSEKGASVRGMSWIRKLVMCWRCGYPHPIKHGFVRKRDEELLYLQSMSHSLRPVVTGNHGIHM